MSTPHSTASASTNTIKLRSGAKKTTTTATPGIQEEDLEHTEPDGIEGDKDNGETGGEELGRNSGERDDVDGYDDYDFGGRGNGLNRGGGGGGGDNGGGGGEGPAGRGTREPAGQPIKPVENPAHPRVKPKKIPSDSNVDAGKLDKTSHNWIAWSKQISAILGCNNGLQRHLVRNDAAIPNHRTEPVAYQNYCDNDQGVISFIYLNCSKHEADVIDGIEPAYKVWSVLKQRHEQQGPVNQIRLMQEMNTLNFEADDELDEKLGEYRRLNKMIWASGPITEDSYLMVMLMKGLSQNYPHVKDHAACRVTEQTIHNPYTTFQLGERVEMENQLKRAKMSQSPTTTPASTLNITQKENKRNGGITCDACKYTGYTIETCIRPGGRMQGHTIQEAMGKARELREARKGKGKAKPAGIPSATVQTINGKAYIIDNGQAYLIHTNNDNPTPTETHTTEVLSTTMKMAMCSGDYDENYFQEHHSTSIDWDTTALCAKTTSNSTATPDPFILDSGASVHVSNNAKDFSDLKSVTTRFIKGVNGSTIQAEGIGCIRLTLDSGQHLYLDNSLYVPQSSVRLISIPCLVKSQNLRISFDNPTVELLDKSSNNVIATGTIMNDRNLYRLNPVQHHIDNTLIIQSKPTLDVWHKRLGHAAPQLVHDTIKSLPSASADLSSTPHKCDSCIRGKQTRTIMPSLRSGVGEREILERVYVDLSGPSAVRSRNGRYYSMKIVDGYTRAIFVYHLTKKSEAFETLKKFEVWARTQMPGHRLRSVLTDNGELRSKEMRDWCESLGITHLLTAPHSSAMNGSAERAHLTISNRARAMRIACHAPDAMWDIFETTATYLSNRTVSRTLSNRTPYEMWHGRQPDLSHLREIGCRAFVLTEPVFANPKILPRSEEYVLVGYTPNSKAYRCWDPKTGRTIDSYNVRFIESWEEPHTTPSAPLTIRIPPHITSQETPQPEEEPQIDDNIALAAQRDSNAATVRLKEEHCQAAYERRRIRLQVRNELGACDPTLLASLSTNHTGPLHPDTPILHTDDSRIYQLLSTSIDSPFDDDPGSVEEALNGAEREQWMEGIREELDGLKEMNVYRLVKRSEVPNGRKVLKNKFVLKKKRDENGKVVRWKARLVVKGFEQIYGQDYTDTTSPTARLESFRLLLHIAAALGWDAHQIDVKTAYLYGILPDDEKQYMEQPKGFEELGDDYILELLRALYGMKQGGRIWNRTMHEEMVSLGFTRLGSEHCIYYRKTEEGTMLSAVHVDDFLLIGENGKTITRFKGELKVLWKIADLGEIRFCIGIAVERNRNNGTILLSQTALIDRIIDTFGQNDAHATKIPFDPNTTLRKPTSDDGPPTSEVMKLPYRSLVGMLMYVAIGTRPDISYSVSRLSTFFDCWRRTHWDAAIRVVRYLKGTRTLRLSLGGSNHMRLLGYADSDFAGCIDTRRSIGSYCFTMGSGVISWSSRKQTTVAGSSTEAEYVSLSESTREALWLRQLLKEIGFPQKQPTPIMGDNNGAAALSKDPRFHARAKHIDVKYHMIRDYVEKQYISVHHVPSKDNIADILTKPLPYASFSYLRSHLGLA